MRRPVGYWINQYDIEGWSLNDPVYVEAKDVYFYKSKKRPSQLREMSDMAPTITRVRDTNEFITAVSRQGADRGLPGCVHQAGNPGGRFWPRRHQNAGRRNGL